MWVPWPTHQTNSSFRRISRWRETKKKQDWNRQTQNGGERMAGKQRERERERDGQMMRWSDRERAGGEGWRERKERGKETKGE